jgi:hypothetical protein
MFTKLKQAARMFVGFHCMLLVFYEDIFFYLYSFKVIFLCSKRNLIL